MIKLFSLSFSLIILIQSLNISFSDILRLDDLLEHAQFHNKKYGDNLFVFISKHYGKLKKNHKIGHDEETDDHEKLPFQHETSITIVFEFKLNNLSLIKNKFDYLENSETFFYYKAIFSSLPNKGIFQPPRAT